MPARVPADRTADRLPEAVPAAFETDAGRGAGRLVTGFVGFVGCFAAVDLPGTGAVAGSPVFAGAPPVDADSARVPGAFADAADASEGTDTDAAAAAICWNWSFNIDHHRCGSSAGNAAMPAPRLAANASPLASAEGFARLSPASAVVSGDPPSRIDCAAASLTAADAAPKARSVAKVARCTSIACVVDCNICKFSLSQCSTARMSAIRLSSSSTCVNGAIISDIIDKDGDSPANAAPKGFDVDGAPDAAPLGVADPAPGVIAASAASGPH